MFKIIFVILSKFNYRILLKWGKTMLFQMVICQPVVNLKEARTRMCPTMTCGDSLKLLTQKVPLAFTQMTDAK